jgi:small-conductance mechanosensitive channel
MMMRISRALFLLLFVALASPAGFAQSVEAPATYEYGDWEKTALRAEEAIAAGRASSLAFEQLRSDLVVWRNVFFEAQGTNRSAIETLQSQIDALGPKAGDGVEAVEITAKRDALNRQMAELRAPVQEAEVAYSRADGLIRAVDRIIRGRQTEALLKIGETPLNPANWPLAVVAIQDSFGNLYGELQIAWASDVLRNGARKNLPFVAGFLLLAFVMLMRGRRWMERLTRRVMTTTRAPLDRPRAGRWFVTFLTSVGQVVLPVIGIYAFSEAVYATGLIGVRGDLVLAILPQTGLVFFGARWLGGRIFPQNVFRAAPLALSGKQRRRGRLYAAVLGLLWGVNAILDVMARFDTWSPTAVAVASFPVLLLAGFALFRIAQLLNVNVQNEQVEGEERSYKSRMLYLLSRAIIALAGGGVALAAVGYFEAGQALVFPTAISLAVLAFLMVLQKVVYDVYAMVARSGDGGDALTPVLVGFALYLASVPVFALIWGARLADLTEIWARFKEGFWLGETRISPTDFLLFLMVFIFGYMLTRLFQGMLRSTLLPRTKLDVGGRNAIVSGVGYIGIFLAAVVAITSAGIDLSSLAIVAGALSVGIGFGLQNIVSNFVSGIILLIERPISEGDWIEVGGQMGYVRDISVRSTRIETFDRTDVIVPNADLVSGMVTNWTRGNSVGRVIVPVGVAYGTDTRRVETILREIALAHPMVLANPGPSVVFQGFGADSLDFEIRAILRDVNWLLSVKSEMNHEIARRFTEENIEIPFAQRDVWLRNPEVLNRDPQAE